MKFVKFCILFIVTLKTCHFLLLRTRNYLRIFKYDIESTLMMFYAKNMPERALMVASADHLIKRFNGKPRGKN